jgi:hypothetical protein
VDRVRRQGRDEGGVMGRRRRVAPSCACLCKWTAGTQGTEPLKNPAQGEGTPSGWGSSVPAVIPSVVLGCDGAQMNGGIVSPACRPLKTIRTRDTGVVYSTEQAARLWDMLHGARGLRQLAPWGGLTAKSPQPDERKRFGLGEHRRAVVHPNRRNGCDGSAQNGGWHQRAGRSRLNRTRDTWGCCCRKNRANKLNPR